MAISDSVRDQLLTLAVAANALAEYAKAASENANSDSVTADPMMRSVRQGFLQVQSISTSFLTIDRPDSGGSRFSGTAISAAIDATNATVATKTQAKAKFVGTSMYSNTQIKNRLFDFVAANTLTNPQLTTIENELGAGADLNVASPADEEEETAAAIVG